MLRLKAAALAPLSTWLKERGFGVIFLSNFFANPTTSKPSPFEEKQFSLEQKDDPEKANAL